jgi:SAM-dependent MidA family methyltransferase
VKEATPLEPLLLEWIAERGPMPFAAFMQMALYHPSHGYYASSAPKTGWSGDFLTSPELDRGFGELWARGFEQLWVGCGSPSRFQVTEVGPGEAGFAEAVLKSSSGSFAAALEYRLVERNPHLQERQRARLEPFPGVLWSESIVDVPHAEAGIVFANEVMDNLPVHVVERSEGRLWEVCVTVEEGMLSTVRLPPSNPELERFLTRTGVSLPEGHRIEVPLAAESFVARTAALLSLGALIVVDYGAEGSALAERSQGSLVCYSPTGADDDLLARPGDKDITSLVNWTGVRVAGAVAGLEMTGPRRQREVLLALGLRELDHALRSRHQQDLAAGDGAGAMEALSRRQALSALVDEGGLGGLGVVAGLRGTEPPSWLA